MLPRLTITEIINILKAYNESTPLQRKQPNDVRWEDYIGDMHGILHGLLNHALFRVKPRPRHYILGKMRGGHACTAGSMEMQGWHVYMPECELNDAQFETIKVTEDV